ncbi:MAG TPA: enoyl-ACP reductase [bacterium]|jgi:enoyl-[acyl-carrier protein] reductase I|nr:enoyl-ACP reductase [bacterium]
MGLLTGKKALIFGVANERSIAWGIAEALHKEGCELGFTYLGEALEKRVRPLADSVGSKLILPCDVTKDDEIAAVYREVEKAWGKFDILIHSLAFAKREELGGEFVNTSRDGFALALDVSAYSLVAITRPAVPLLKPGAAILALTFYGSEKVMKNYNVMGVAKAALEACVRYLAADLGPKDIRVNAISAGPIKTLAASGVAGFRAKLRLAELSAPLRRTVTQQEVGNSALYLCSSMASGVTGEIHFVDSGVNIMGESAQETAGTAE